MTEKKRKIMVTGFLPFNGEPVNPSREVALRLTSPENCELVTAILPVEYEKAGTALAEEVRRHQPDILISLGQGGLRPALNIEFVAINFATTRSSDGEHLIADEGGRVMDDVVFDPNGPRAYFATLPVRRMCRAARSAGVPAGISYSAGTYLCNYTMYTGLKLGAESYPAMKSTFIHLPFLPEQLTWEQEVTNWPISYSMPLEDMVKGIQAILEDLAAGED